LKTENKKAKPSGRDKPEDDDDDDDEGRSARL
jgi:hypothetical protein